MSDIQENFAVYSAARQKVEDACFSAHAHAIYISQTEDSQNNPVPIIQVEVDQLLTAHQYRSRNQKEVPNRVEVSGRTIEVQRIESAQARDGALYDHEMRAQTNLGPSNLRHRGCFPTPIPGGAQIAPEGANWVGTLGCAFAFNTRGETIVGALTNNHVAVKRNARKGDRIMQPSSREAPIGALYDWKKIDFSSNAANLIDAAVINTWVKGGPYGDEGMHTVGASQVDIGPYNPEPMTNPKMNQRVIKSGRTTGVTRGRLIGLDATTRVGYEQGAAKFVRQFMFAGDRGDLSAPGDSGSLIMTEDTNQPLALLFAGGGGTTIGNPIQFVIDWANGYFPQQQQ